MKERSVNQTVKEIRALKIQGASQVRKAVVLAIKHSIEKSKAKSAEAFRRELKKNMLALANARPTEPETRTALRIILKASMKRKKLKELKQEIVDECVEYEENRKNAMHKIAHIGAKKLSVKHTVFTHCHSHTVEGILIEMHRQKTLKHVYLTETRPRWQGRITAKNLRSAGIKCTMIVDSASRAFIGKADVFLTGCDAILGNGAIVNKIGTSMISLAAKKLRVPHYVATSSYSFDPATFFGAEEKIEERPEKEIWDKKPKGLEIRNPAFDITEPELVTGIICEKKVFTPKKFVSHMVKGYAIEGKKFVSLIELLKK